jgi:hypothetical protein
MASNDDISADRAPDDGAPPPPLPPLPPPQLADVAPGEEVIDATNTAEYYYANGLFANEVARCEFGTNNGHVAKVGIYFYFFCLWTGLHTRSKGRRKHTCETG